MKDYAPAIRRAISGHNIESYGGMGDLSLSDGRLDVGFKSLPHFREECNQKLLGHFGAPKFRVGDVEMTWSVSPCNGQKALPYQFLAAPDATADRLLSLISTGIPWGWAYLCRNGRGKDKITIHSGRRWVGDLNECSEADRLRVIARSRPVVERVSVVLGDPVRVPQNDGYRSALWQHPTGWAVEYALR